MSNAASGQRQGGFSLVELMIVVVIIGVISAIAYPSYQRNVRESNRSEAHAALVTFAALQERFFSDNNSYGLMRPEGNVCTADPLGIYIGNAIVGGASAQRTEHGFYDVTVTLPTTPTDAGCRVTGAHASSYLLTATAVAGSPQARDTGCLTITLDNTGAKGPAGCWR